MLALPLRVIAYRMWGADKYHDYSLFLTCCMMHHCQLLGLLLILFGVVTRRVPRLFSVIGYPIADDQARGWNSLAAT